MLEFFKEFYRQPYHKFKFYKLHLFYRVEHNIAFTTENIRVNTLTRFGSVTNFKETQIKENQVFLTEIQDL